MGREKEIEEIAEAIFQNCNCGLFFSEAEEIARFVIEEQGYRKQSEVAKEIFDEIERTFKGLLNGDISNILKLLSAFIKVRAKLIGTMKKHESPLFVISDGVAMIYHGNVKGAWREDIALGLKMKQ